MLKENAGRMERQALDRSSSVEEAKQSLDGSNRKDNKGLSVRSSSRDR